MSSKTQQVAAIVQEFAAAFASLDADVPPEASQLLAAQGFTLAQVRRRGKKVFTMMDHSSLSPAGALELQEGIEELYADGADNDSSHGGPMDPLDVASRAAVAASKGGASNDASVRAGRKAGSDTMTERDMDAGTHLALVNVLKSGHCVPSDWALRGGKDYEPGRSRSELESMADGFGRVLKGDKWKQYVENQSGMDSFVNRGCDKLEAIALNQCSKRFLQWWGRAQRLAMFPGESYTTSTLLYIRAYLERYDCTLPVIFDETIWREIKDSRELTSDGSSKSEYDQGRHAPRNMFQYHAGTDQISWRPPQMRECFVCGSLEHLVGSCPHKELAEKCFSSQKSHPIAEASSGKPPKK